MLDELQPVPRFVRQGGKSNDSHNVSRHEKLIFICRMPDSG